MDARDGTQLKVPKESRRPAGTVNWGTATVTGIFAGLLYGGSKEAAACVSKDAEVMLKLGSTPDKREQYRLTRDAMEKRISHVVCLECAAQFNPWSCFLFPTWLGTFEAFGESK